MAYEISSSIAQSTVSTQNVSGSSTTARASGGHFSPDGTRLAVPKMGSSESERGIDIYTSSSVDGWTKTDFCPALDGSDYRYVEIVQWLSNSELVAQLNARGLFTFTSSSSGWSSGVRRTAATTAKHYAFSPDQQLVAVYIPFQGTSGVDFVDIYESGSGLFSFASRIDNASGVNERIQAIEWLSNTDIAIGVPEYDGNFGGRVGSGEVTIWRTTDGGSNFSEIENVEGSAAGEHLGAALYYHSASGNLIVGTGLPTSNLADTSTDGQWFLYQSTSAGGYVQGTSDRTLITETGSSSGRVPLQYYMQKDDANNRFAIGLAASTATGTNGEVMVWESGSADGWKGSIIDNNVYFRYPNAGSIPQVGLSVNGLVANNNNVSPQTGDKQFRVHTPTTSSGDTTGPSITSVELYNITHLMNGAGFYFYDDSGYLGVNSSIDVKVTFDEAVTVVTTGGTPTLALNIGGVSRDATYRGSLYGGSGTTEINFRYVFASGDTDNDGISIDAGSISLNGGTMQDAAGNDATLSYSAVAANSSLKVDGTAPTITSVVMASDNSYATVTFSEDVQGYPVGNSLDTGDFSLSLAGGNSSAINLQSAPSSVSPATVGSKTVFNVYLNGTDLDTNATGNETLVVDSANDTSIFDRAGNGHTAAHAGVSLNDTLGPEISSISFPDSSDNTKVKIVFNERVGRSNGSLWTSSNFPTSTYINFTSSNALIKNFTTTFDEYQTTNVANDTIVLDIAYDGEVQSGDTLNAQFFSNATNGVYDANGSYTAGTISASSDASFPTTGRARTTFNRTFKVVNATSGSAFAYLSTDRDEGDFAFGSAVYGNRMVFLGSVNSGQTGSFTVSDEKHNDHLYNDSALATYTLLVYNAEQDTGSFSPSSPSGAGKASKTFRGYEFNNGILSEPHMASDRRDWEITYRQDDKEKKKKSLGNWVVTKTDSSVLDYFVGRSHVKTQVSLVGQGSGTGSIRWDWGEKVRFPSHSEDGSDGFSSFRTQIATQNSHLSSNLSERIFDVSLDSTYTGSISNVRVDDLVFTTSSDGVTDGAWLLTFNYDGLADGTERIQVSYSGEPYSNQYNVYFYDPEFNYIQTVDALLDNFYTSWPIGTDRASFRVGLSQDALATEVSETIAVASGGTVKAGGTNDVPRASVSIPANALASETTITVDTSDTSIPGELGLGVNGDESLSPLVSLKPHGTTFSSPVTVTFNLIGSGEGTCPANAQLWKRNGPNKSWYPVPTNLYSCSDGVITLSTTSFSDYIIIGGQQVARTKLNNVQLARLEDQDKVLPEAINITGSSESYITTITDDDSFIVQSGSGFSAPISASAMAAYFAGAVQPENIVTTDTDAAGTYRITFTDATGTDNESTIFTDGDLLYNAGTNALSLGVLSASSDITGSAALLVGTSATIGNGLTVTAGGATVTAGGLTVSAGASSFAGDVDLGDATSDTITATGRFDSSLVPSADAASDLGSSTLGWNDLHLGSGGVINLDGGDVTLTHAAGKLTLGGDGAVEFDFNNHEMTNVDIDSGAIDGTVIGANSAAAAEFTTVSGSGAAQFASMHSDSVNIDGGAIDGTAIGANAQSTIEGTTISGSGNLSSGGALDVALGADIAGAVALGAAGGSADTTVRGDLAVDENLTVTGNLVVQGETTTVDSTNTLLQDPLLVIGSSSNGSASLGDRGILFDDADGTNQLFMWDNSESHFTLGATTSGHDATGNFNITAGDLKLRDLSGSAAEFSGIVSASAFQGDGAQLQNVGASVDDSSDADVTLQVPFLSGSGASTTLFIDSGSFTFNPSSKLLGLTAVTASGDVKVGALYIDDVEVTATSAELNHLDGIADAAYDRSADSVVFFDATDSKLKHESANDFTTALAGDGLASASGQLAVQVSGAMKLASDKVGITGSFAGDGLSYAGGDDSISSIALDLNELSAAAVNAAADSIAIIDADDNGSKKESIADLATAMAGDGLAAAAGVFSVDMNELTAASVDIGNDSIAIVDASDSNATRKESLADVMAAAAGDGLAAASGVLAVDINELTAAVVDISADSIAIVDANDSNATRKESLADVMSAAAGDGIAASAGVLAVDINELTAAAVDIGNDSIAIVDASDSNATRKESLADVMTAAAGDGLAATAGVLAVQVSGAVKVASDKVGITGSFAGDGLQAAGGDDSISALSITYRELIATKYQSGSILDSNALTASLTAGDDPVDGSLQVYLNGMLLVQSGSVEVSSSAGGVASIWDYKYAGSAGAREVHFLDAIDDDDVIQIKYIKK